MTIKNIEEIKNSFYNEAKGMEDNINIRLNYINALLKQSYNLQETTIAALKVEKTIALKELNAIKELVLRTETYSFDKKGF